MSAVVTVRRYDFPWISHGRDRIIVIVSVTGRSGLLRKLSRSQSSVSVKRRRGLHACTGWTTQVRGCRSFVVLDCFDLIASVIYSRGGRIDVITVIEYLDLPLPAQNVRVDLLFAGHFIGKSNDLAASASAAGVARGFGCIVDVRSNQRPAFPIVGLLRVEPSRRRIVARGGPCKWIQDEIGRAHV